MGFPEESFTTKSAEQDPASAFTVATSALSGACPVGAEFCAGAGIEISDSPTSQPANRFLCKIRIRTHLRAVRYSSGVLSVPCRKYIGIMISKRVCFRPEVIYERLLFTFGFSNGAHSRLQH